MKTTVMVSLISALFATNLALAQSGGMKDMDMNKGMESKKEMDMQKCKEMMGMKDMDMKGMDMQKCQDMMNGKDKKAHAKDAKTMTHKAVGVVKAVDADNGKVTLAHEPVKSLKWPAMIMDFSVKDKMLFNKLAVGKKVNVELMKEGADYVITSVK